jgi:hypothetical protein
MNNALLFLPGYVTWDSPGFVGYCYIEKRKFSPAAIKHMREAQQSRWDKVRGETAPAPATAPAKKPRRKMSAAGEKHR